jgi:RecG-like helicase
MNFVVIEESKLNQLFDDLAEIKKAINTEKEESLVNQWLQSETVRKMLGVCPKTWQDYRDKKVIPFSQFGRKIYIKKTDLDAFMQKNYIKQ